MNSIVKGGVFDKAPTAAVSLALAGLGEPHPALQCMPSSVVQLLHASGRGTG